MESMEVNDFWRGRNVLVTGGTGLLGSEMVANLLRMRANVVVLLRDGVHNSRYFLEGMDKKTTVVRGDLTDFRQIERTLNEYEVDTVFHVGAQTIVQTANRSPLSTFESNIQGTWNLLEACRLSRLVTRIVVASSDKAYGSQKILPYTEETPLQGEHPYDVSKSCADLISLAYHKTYGLPVSITRCGNFYGPGDLNWNRIVPDTIRSLYLGKRPLIRSDGTMTRDYFFISDGAHAYLTLARQMDRPDVKGHAFNFSSDRPYSVLELVRKIIQMYPSTLEPEILNQAKGEISHQSLSSERARTRLGWQPRYTLDQGLRITIDWYKEFLKTHG